MTSDEQTGSKSSLTFIVDTRIFSNSSVFRACYKFTDRVFIFLSHPTDSPEAIAITVKPKQPIVDLNLLMQEFFNELIDQGIREFLEEEFGPIRNLIVAQAFSEGNLLEDTSETPFNDDEDRQLA